MNDIWLRDPLVQKLLATLNKGQKTRARIVGGAVRDALLGEHVGDIDIATTYSPQEVSTLLQEANFTILPIGIEHGTIRAIYHKRVFEITSLRQDIAADGRHAKIALTDQWEVDALRRDFTINALYMDADGTLHDPLGQAKADLEKLRVRFIGNAEQRIQEDYLRILRFFRFSFRFGKTPDSEGMEACARHLEHLQGLSAERICEEIIKILALENAPLAFDRMAEIGLLKIILPELGTTKHLVRLLQIYPNAEPIVRLACLMEEEHVEAVSKRLNLSKASRQRLKTALHFSKGLQPSIHKKQLHILVYEAGRMGAIDALCLAHARVDGEQWGALLSEAESWDIPQMPISGKRLEEENIKAGPKMGEIQKAFEQWWKEEDFPLAEEQIEKGLQYAIRSAS